MSFRAITWLRCVRTTCTFSILVVFLGCASVSSDAKSLIGQQVPEGRLMLLKGEDIALRGKEGINLALLFWATWCSHSRSVVDEFEDLARAYAYRGDIEFYGISVDKNEDINLLKSRIRTQNLKTMIHVFSGNDTQDEAFLALKGSRVPYVIFVDAQGIVRYVDYSVSGLGDFLREHFRSSRAASE